MNNDSRVQKLKMLWTSDSLDSQGPIDKIMGRGIYSAYVEAAVILFVCLGLWLWAGYSLYRHLSIVSVARSFSMVGVSSAILAYYFIHMQGVWRQKSEGILPYLQLRKQQLLASLRISRVTYNFSLFLVPVSLPLALLGYGDLNLYVESPQWVVMGLVVWVFIAAFFVYKYLHQAKDEAKIQRWIQHIESIEMQYICDD